MGMKKNSFNEATRVQMPALVHLTRIGYDYFGKISEDQEGIIYDPKTNILIQVFKKQFLKLNPNNEEQFQSVLSDIKVELDNNDIGETFYKRLTSISPTKLIDFENPKNNVFHCTAEFTCKNENEEFRPDITLFVNGLPLVIIEVKKPNNIGGIIAESNRMNKVRFPNRKFRRFINITQLMIFSNNMEYDSMGGTKLIQGAFYCTSSKEQVKFNCFREENSQNKEISDFINDFPYKDINPTIERKILDDFNNQVLHTAPEYQTNLHFNTPTNRIITSMCSPERLLYLIKYGIAYVNMQKEIDGKIEWKNEKHIMRYQQFFASLAITEKLNQGIKSGVIWHTQGSGKTALSYYLTKILSDYYAKQNIVTKFYFIVDRLDLLEQASSEFEARGLSVMTASNRKELMDQFKNVQALEGSDGRTEITVVNIQKFEEDKTKVTIPEYAINLQRIFIVDEAHRGYNPKGSFLANLLEADTNSIKIALTGTPLLKEERSTWRVFGDYIHTYYYDKSIRDGYTLKIIREDIETSYKEKLNEIYEKLEVLVEKKDIKKNQIVEHENYVKELLRFIFMDLKKFRQIQGDDTLGAMIVCETSEQARKLYAYFDTIQDEINKQSSDRTVLKAGLILHDEEDKETRTRIINDFKKNMTVDILIVFNMLLTGFDAPRLKRLYISRKLKDHNLLQAITRVNRPYKENRYGYIIDFADIKKNFEETNQAYLEELSRFNNTDGLNLDDKIDTFRQVIEDKDVLIAKINEVRNVLFNYTTDNLEEFSSEISTVEDKNELLKLKRVLEDAKDCCNIVRTFGDEELKTEFNKMDLYKLSQMISEIKHHINLINQKESFSNDKTRMIVNEAMQDIDFSFAKISEEELKIISGGAELKAKWQKTIIQFTENIDKEDPEYITLLEAFRERFNERGFVIHSIEEFEKTTQDLDDIIKKLETLKRNNKVLTNKYNGDKKFARVHKRIREENINREKNKEDSIISVNDTAIMDVLLGIKIEIDKKVYDRNDILKKDAYFEKTVMSQITEGMQKLNCISTRNDRIFIRDKIAKEYLLQYNEIYPASVSRA